MPPRPRAAAKGPSAGKKATRGKRQSSHREGLEWSLRSLHKIDTGAQHFLQSYYDEESDSSGDDSDSDEMEDQTAYAIFKGKDENSNKGSLWSGLSAPLRTGIVDGKKKIFELLKDVTQKPETPRSERLTRSREIVNSNQSNWEARSRFWLMHFSVAQLSVLYLATFIVMNVIFATFFYALEGHCCGDPELKYRDSFAFTVQTSTTIGYGGYVPQGYISNFLVVILSYISMLMNTLFAGLLFTKYSTPAINIQFSEIMTLCNVNGVPCLSFRCGNADGKLNALTDINVRLTYSYQIPYDDHKGQQQFFRQTEELKLLSNRTHQLLEVWTLRHVVDESSPLFGLNFKEHPGNKIYEFTLSIDAVQKLTKSSVNVQTEYAVADIMVGHSFQNQVSVDEEKRIDVSDYSKMSDTEPYPVWYPALAGAYADRSKDIFASNGNDNGHKYGA